MRKWVGHAFENPCFDWAYALNKRNVKGFTPKAYSRLFQTNIKKISVCKLKKGSELEKIYLLAWYSPVRYFFSFLHHNFLIHWGYKPTLFVYLSDFPRCKSVNVFMLVSKYVSAKSYSAQAFKVCISHKLITF